MIARVMHGGAADRSGLIAVGDEVGVMVMVVMVMRVMMVVVMVMMMMVTMMIMKMMIVMVVEVRGGHSDV